jgi:hypothetical protein
MCTAPRPRMRVVVVVEAERRCMATVSSDVGRVSNPLTCGSAALEAAGLAPRRQKAGRPVDMRDTQSRHRSP